MEPGCASDLDLVVKLFGNSWWLQRGGSVYSFLNRFRIPCEILK